MMTGIGIVLKKINHCSKNLVVRPFASIEDFQLLFHHLEQFLKISMLLLKDIDNFDHLRLLPANFKAGITANYEH